MTITQAQLQQLLELYQHQQIPEAIALAQQLTEQSPQHGGIWKLLGILQRQHGDNHAARQALQQAVQYLPLDAESHNALGVVHQALEEDELALACFQQAVSIAPNNAIAHNSLGTLLQKQRQYSQAAQHYQQATALQPDYARAWNNLASVLYEQEQLESAYEAGMTAFSLNAQDAEICYNLGLITRAKAQDDVISISFFQRALLLRPNYGESMQQLVSVYIAQGNYPAALQWSMQALQSLPNTLSKQLFALCAKQLPPQPQLPHYMENLLRAVRELWCAPHELVQLICCCVLNNLDTAHDAKTLLHTLKDNELLQAILVITPIADWRLEQVLTQIRQYLLNLALSNDNIPEDVLKFTIALAQQCFINEYVFSDSPDEQKALSRLLSTITPFRIAVQACYQPLYQVQSQLADYDEVTQLIQQQVVEPRLEQYLRAQIACLTPIQDDVSCLVQAQYEQHPYPRWIDTPTIDKVREMGEYLRNKFPHRSFLHSLSFNTPVQILVAGCGTGLQPISIARRTKHAEILAIDLSRSSLAYAQRKAMQLGIHHIQFAQADLLQLPSLAREFDVIESVGVLHHMDDPWLGWKTLLGMLRKGGVMKVGLYSAQARRAIIETREMIAQQTTIDTDDAIRQARQEIIRQPERFATALQSFDFYSTSTCRDLLFHVHENNLNWQNIVEFIQQQGLQFIGFELYPASLQKYRQHFPTDQEASNMDNWIEFEQMYPDTFTQMYQFWVAKPV